MKHIQAIGRALRAFSGSVSNILVWLVHRVLALISWPVPNYSRSMLYLQGFLVLVFAYVLQRYRIPAGVAISVVGAFGIVVAILRLSKAETAVWIALAFILVGAEINSIYREQDKHDIEMRTQQKEFAVILLQAQQQFSATMERMGSIEDKEQRNVITNQKTLNQITGAGRFCYLTSMFDVPPNFVRLAVLSSGDLPITTCHVAISEHFTFEETQKLLKTQEGQNRLGRATQQKDLGPVPAGHKGFMTDIFLENGRTYDIDIYTRNEEFRETLSIQPNKTKGLLSTRQIQITGKKGDKEVVIFHEP